MNTLFTLITVQALLGTLDNFWHHEIVARLPARREAAPELALHAARELLYAFLFLGLAWAEWGGTWAALVAFVVLAEIVITLADFVVEDRTRRLPQLERVLHTVLAINVGAVIAVLVPILRGWWSYPTGVAFVSHGAFSWLFTAFAAGVFVWSLRDAAAVLRHGRPPEWVRDPIMLGSSPSPRTVLVTGATGFIGGNLVRRLLARGEAVIVLTREAGRALDRFGPHVRIVTSLQSIDSGAPIDAIVNLAGAPILGLPWTRARRRTLLASRLDTTRAVVELCARLEKTPTVLVSASAIGYYGAHEDEVILEESGPQDIFQSRLCREWEEAASAAETLGVRVVRLRIGLVLGRDGGALPSLARPLRLGLGAVLGSGKQFVSWIHMEDLLRLLDLAIETPSLRGPVNAVGPQPASHAQLQRALALALRRPLWLRVPAWALRLVLGEMAQLLVDGQRVFPKRALRAGFSFQHPHLREALCELLAPLEGASADAPVELYYNGECPACRVEIDHYARRCERARVGVRFVDASREPDVLAACGLRREHLERRIYLRHSDGSITSGLPAMIELWLRMPGYHRLGRFLSLPLVNAIAVALYDNVIAPVVAASARRHAHRAQRLALQHSQEGG